MIRIAITALLAIAAILGWLHAPVAEHTTAQAAADAAHDAEQQAAIEQRYLQAVQRICGPQAVSMTMEGDRLQCYTPRGRAGAILISGGTL